MPFPTLSAQRIPATNFQEFANQKKGFDKADKPYPKTASHLRLPIRSEIHPEKTFNTLAVASAIPSISPMILVLTPSTLDRNRGAIR